MKLTSPQAPFDSNLTGVLQNMSAPPRMTITMQPLRNSAPGAGNSPAGSLPTMQLRPVARVNIELMIDEMFPIDVPFFFREFTPKYRLAALVQISRDPGGDFNEADMAGLRHCTMEYLNDELRRNVAKINPVALGLPACGVVVRNPSSDGPGIDYELDPARVLALISRTAGRVYVANRSPRVRDLANSNDDFWIYAADPFSNAEVES